MRIAWLSDFDVVGSGYRNLSVPLCEGLANKGYEIKVSGLGYRGEQHDYNFSIFPAGNIGEALGIIQNIYNLWGFDILVVALDIPLQLRILQMMRDSKRPFKYAGIMPVEAGPLTMSWAMGMMLIDKIFIISEFGTKECELQGISAEYLPIGIDTEAWRMPTAEEKQTIRKNMLGLDDSHYVILTVADNQERKNLAAGMKVVADFIKKGYLNVRYMLVTREYNQVGWILRDLAQEWGISDKVMIFERGMDFKKLWSLYVASDMFFLPSKTEGLGMPLLEAMAVGLPCMGTKCSGIEELLQDNRGYLVAWKSIYPDCSYRDPFGNGRRYIIDPKHAATTLEWVYEHGKDTVQTARDYVEKRKWDVAVDKLEKSLLGMLPDEQKKPQETNEPIQLQNS